MILSLKESQEIGARRGLQAWESDSSPENAEKERRAGEGPPVSQGGSCIATGEGLPASHGGSQITSTTRGKSPGHTSTPSRDEVNAETYITLGADATCPWSVLQLGTEQEADDERSFESGKSTRRKRRQRDVASSYRKRR